MSTSSIFYDEKSSQLKLPSESAPTTAAIATGSESPATQTTTATATAMPKIAKCSSNKISPIYCGSDNGISAVLENRVKNFFCFPSPMQPPRRGRQPPAPCVRQHVRLRLRGRDVSDPGRGGDGRGGHEGLHRARPEEDGGGDTGGARRFDTDTGVLPSPQVTMLGFSFRIQRLLLPPAAKGLRGDRVRAEAKDHVRMDTVTLPSSKI